MKRYMTPVTETVHVKGENELLAASPKPGVETGDVIVDDFDDEDVSYSRPVFDDIWGDDEV